MNKISHFLIFSALAGSFFACNAVSSLEQQANDQMNEIMNEHGAVGLSVAVVKDGEMVYAGSFGYKNLEDSTFISTDDIFRIASISKSFTATALLQLHELGKFDLDDDVSDAMGMTIRNPNHPDIPITYRMLLTHTSSLNDTMGYFTFNVVDKTINDEYWRSYNSYAPGTAYEYCNLGFNMLGALVEIHSGERFDSYIENHIVKPLNMNAGFNVAALDANLFVTLYAFRDGKPVASPDAYNRIRDTSIEKYVMGRSTTIFSPTGGMKTAPKDLAKHMLVQINGGTFNGVQILKPESVVAMQTPHDSINYGFAIRTTDKLIEGEILKGHTGDAYGLYSAMFFSPEKKFGFVMMTNGCPAKRNENDFLTIQADVINALYNIFIRM